MPKISRRRLPSLLRCTYLATHSEREGIYVVRCELSRFTSGHVHLLNYRHAVAGPVPHRRAVAS